MMSTAPRYIAAASLALSFLSSGCKSGTLGTEPPGPHPTDAAAADGDTDAGADLPPVQLMDGGAGDGDAAPAPDGGPDAPVDPDAGGSDAGAAGPCADVRCGANASCDPGTGECACTPGFTDEGGDCVPAAPGDPAGRTVAEVCNRWNEGHRTEASSPWTAGDEMCAPGTMSRAAIEDTLRRINMYRWLGGHGPVTDNPDLHEAQKECARMMDANGRLSHSPPESWTCYTSDGAAAAGRSNIALGTRSAAAAVDLYMRDASTPSLGHRRWILNGPLGQVGIGHSGSGDCLAVFDTSGTSTREWTAYPNPGPAPIETTHADWSLQGRRIGSDPEVTITRLGDGATMPVTDVRTMRSSFLRDGGIGWSLDGWRAEAGAQYRVTVTAGDESIDYVVEPVDCSSR